ncbi:MAG: hypothetical protein ACK42I_10510, partial [Thermomicrobium sp.]
VPSFRSTGGAHASSTAPSHGQVNRVVSYHDENDQFPGASSRNQTALVNILLDLTNSHSPARVLPADRRALTLSVIGTAR